MRGLIVVVALFALACATVGPAAARVGCSDNTCANWSDGALFDAYNQWNWSDLLWIFR